jgi:hypothetical protein
MLQKIIDLEQKRLKDLGFDSIVSTETLVVNESLVLKNIGNDTCIMTGIRISNVDMLNNQHNVMLVSSTDSVQLNQQDFAALGTSIFKVLKDFIIVRTTDENEFTADVPIPEFWIEFVKITPLVARKAA